jgi:hypothetical protein
MCNLIHIAGEWILVQHIVNDGNVRIAGNPMISGWVTPEPDSPMADESDPSHVVTCCHSVHR